MRMVAYSVEPSAGPDHQSGNVDFTPMTALLFYPTTTFTSLPGT